MVIFGGGGRCPWGSSVVHSVQLNADMESLDPEPPLETKTAAVRAFHAS